MMIAHVLALLSYNKPDSFFGGGGTTSGGRGKHKAT
jgi:hypothetical protein